MRLRRKHTPQDVQLNLTSMLDVIFLLIIFFILVTNFAAADLPDLEVPDPERSEARKSEEGARVVNIVPHPSRPSEARHVLIAGQRFAVRDREAITEWLRAERERRDGQLVVDLRADARLEFDAVEPVMMAITDAGIAEINLVSIRQTGTP